MDMEPDGDGLEGYLSAIAAAGSARRGLDWRVWLGLGLTFTWLSLGALFLIMSGDGPSLLHDAGALGSFLEGAFAPLAFLWLVIGYFLQQRELSQNTEALRLQFQEVRRQVEQATIQSRAIAANEQHARQDTFLSISQQVNYQLGTIAGFLFLSSQGAAGTGAVDSEEISELFRQLTRGDPQVFSLRLLNLAVNAEGSEAHELFYGTPTRARHSNNFIHTFDRLVNRAEECDPEGMIAEALRLNTHGLVHQIMLRERQDASPDLADPDRTGTYLNIAAGSATDLQSTGARQP